MFSEGDLFSVISGRPEMTFLFFRHLYNFIHIFALGFEIQPLISEFFVFIIT